MKKLIQVILILLTIQSIAQKNKNKVESTPQKRPDYAVPLTPEQWAFKEGKVEFVEYKGKKAMKLAQNSGQVVLKDVVFKDGTIEFDVEPVLTEFAQSIYFHQKDPKEQEIVYLRLARSGNKLANEGIQYCPYFDAVNMWDMYSEYQAPALVKAGEWNHMKLIISGKRLRVFLNGSPQPVLDIPKLEGNASEGSIAFEGAAHIANVQLKPNEVEGLSPMELPDLTDHDAYYLRKWALTAPQNLPAGSELWAGNLPKLELFTDSIMAERRGLINLTRKFGGSPSRRVVWLKTKIMAKEAAKTNLQLGFSDEVWVFLNNQPVLADKNLFLQNMRKYPDGRISIQNTTAKLTLKPGENDLLIGVANDFYGWGIMARLESTEGITETDKVTNIISVAKEIGNLDLEPYLGTYSNNELPFKLSFSKKEKVLIVQPTGQEAVELQALGKYTFAYAPSNAVFEFSPVDKKVILRQGVDTKEFKKE
ncbi:family 16 glycoside hydrolase [Runella sp.]|uniref:family 16 glycoside hydrolase n=1 Tax=Runella sp. TaxID=1960881 RepID=UPI003D0CB9DC